jgi:hypothetical protein
MRATTRAALVVVVAVAVMALPPAMIVFAPQWFFPVVDTLIVAGVVALVFQVAYLVRRRRRSRPET